MCIRDSHTYHHVEITKLSDEEAMYEINKTDELIAAITGQRVQYIRPPFGVWKRELENYLDVLPCLLYTSMSFLQYGI